GVDEATANAEIGARTFEAQYCSVCIEYVNAASEFEDEARKLNCPLRGPRWPSDANGLMQFCLAQGHSDIAATVRWLQGVLNHGLKRVNACAAAKRTAPLVHPMPKFATPAGVGRIGRGP